MRFKILIFSVYDYEYKFSPQGAEAQVSQKNIFENILLIKIFCQSKSKIFLLCWCPDSAAIKKKMLYSSSFDTLKKAFVGVHKVRFLTSSSAGRVLSRLAIR